MNKAFWKKIKWKQLSDFAKSKAILDGPSIHKTMFIAKGMKVSSEPSTPGNGRNNEELKNEQVSAFPGKLQNMGNNTVVMN